MKIFYIKHVFVEYEWIMVTTFFKKPMPNKNKRFQAKNSFFGKVFCFFFFLCVCFASRFFCCKLNSRSNEFLVFVFVVLIVRRWTFCRVLVELICQSVGGVCFAFDGLWHRRFFFFFWPKSISNFFVCAFCCYLVVVVCFFLYAFCFCVFCVLLLFEFLAFLFLSFLSENCRRQSTLFWWEKKNRN